MSTPLKAVLFDLDGTLLDTAPDFELVLNQLLETHGQAPLPYEAIRNTVSHGGRALVTLGFELQEGDEGFAERLAELLALYRQNLLVKTRLFPGLEEVLQLIETSGIHWGIVTNKPSEYTFPILEGLGLAERCAVTICPDHVSERKPNPEGLLLACQRIGCEPGEAVYVGDHARDIEAGKNAGMPTIAANYGYIPADDPAAHWQADLLVNRAEEIHDYVAQRLENTL